MSPLQAKLNSISTLHPSVYYRDPSLRCGLCGACRPYQISLLVSRWTGFDPTTVVRRTPDKQSLRCRSAKVMQMDWSSKSTKLRIRARRYGCSCSGSMNIDITTVLLRSRSHKWTLHPSAETIARLLAQQSSDTQLGVYERQKSTQR